MPMKVQWARSLGWQSLPHRHFCGLIPVELHLKFFSENAFSVASLPLPRHDANDSAILRLIGFGNLATWKHVERRSQFFSPQELMRTKMANR